MLKKILGAATLSSALILAPAAFSKDKRLSPRKAPSENFKLKGWTLTLPVDADGDGKAETIKEKRLSNEFQVKPYFYTGEDGGMVFAATVAGSKTSKKTSFTRSELREMMRKGNTDIKTKGPNGTPNKNNWVFSSAPEAAQKLAGGVDGVMEATLAVNRVTVTGKDSEFVR